MDAKATDPVFSKHKNPTAVVAAAAVEMAVVENLDRKSRHSLMELTLL